MEVHSHTHHPTHNKKLREYILEFLMLFLAVFLGFIAENFREHSVEHKKTRQYAQLLYDDLKKHTAKLSEVIYLKIWRVKKIDSLIELIKSPDLQKNASKIYYLNGFPELNFPFKPLDITIQQLRNSGTLRYFRNLQLYNTITRYYNDCNLYLDIENESKIPIDLTSKIFDADKLMSLISITPNVMDAIHEPAKDVDYKLLNTNGLILNEYLLNISKIKLSNDLSIWLLHENIEKDQRTLMDALREEFQVN